MKSRNTYDIKKKYGSVSVFVAIVLASVCLLNCVLLDYSRILTFDYLYNTRVTNACKSMLASFDSLLESKYGLYGFNLGSHPDYDNDFTSFCKIPPQKGILDLTGCKLTESEIKFSESLDKPGALRKEITDLMKIRTPVNTLEKIYEIISSMDNSGKINEVQYHIKEGQRIADTAADKLNKLKYLLEGYYKGDIMCANGFGNSIINYKAIYSILNDLYYLDLNSEDILDELIQSQYSLKLILDTYMSYNADSLAVISELREICVQIDNEINEARILLKEVSENERIQLEEMIKNLESKYNIIYSGLSLDRIKSNIESFKNKYNLLDKNILMAENLKNGSFTDFNINDFKDNIFNAMKSDDIYTSFNISVIMNYPNKTYEAYDTRNKITNLNIGSKYELYEIKSVIYQQLPSVIAGANDKPQGFSFDLENFSLMSDIASAGIGDLIKKNLVNGVEELLISDYIITYFTDRLSSSGKEGDFKCETEYIIGGSRKSSDNEKTVEKEIELIRFIMNLSYLFCDSEKSSFAEAIGDAVALAVSGGIGGDIYSFLIMCGWSVAESLYDIRLLTEGKRVPLIKTKETWHSSIEGLSEENKNENTYGMNYSDYLMILILMIKPDTKLLRISDVIEVNMREYTGTSYKLSGIFTRCTGTAIYSADFVSPIILNKGRKNRYVKTESSYSY